LIGRRREGSQNGQHHIDLGHRRYVADLGRHAPGDLITATWPLSGRIGRTAEQKGFRPTL
jgi:hypothetical protein